MSNMQSCRYRLIDFFNKKYVKYIIFFGAEICNIIETNKKCYFSYFIF